VNCYGHGHLVCKFPINVTVPIRIVLEGLRGEDSIAELCRREAIVQNLYYRWSRARDKLTGAILSGTARRS
jgi:transposase-like protein